MHRVGILLRALLSRHSLSGQGGYPPALHGVYAVTVVSGFALTPVSVVSEPVRVLY